MLNKRRNFIKLAGLAAAGLCFAPTAGLASSGGAAPVKVNADGKKAKRWAMVIDTTKLHGEKAIMELQEACHTVHNVPHITEEDGSQSHLEIKWIWPGSFHETFTEKHNEYLSEDVHHRAYPLLCNHCENPPCVRVCPTQATYKRPDNIVAMDYHRCIGCRYCMAGCPYGARSFNWSEPRDYLDASKLNMRFPTRMRGVVEKCNFCVERLAEGQMPACVEASHGALAFGDLSDENSEVRKLLRENFTIRRKTTAGTEPGVYYII